MRFSKRADPTEGLEGVVQEWGWGPAWRIFEVDRRSIFQA